MLFGDSAVMASSVLNIFETSFHWKNHSGYYVHLDRFSVLFCGVCTRMAVAENFKSSVERLEQSLGLPKLRVINFYKLDSE